MAFVHSKASKVVLDSLSLTGFLKGWEASGEVELSDTTVLGDEGHKFLPGLATGSVSLDGLFDNTYVAGSEDATLTAAKKAAAANVILLAPSGMALGSRVVSLSARETTYAQAAAVADAVSLQSAWTSEGEVDTSAIALHDLTAETTTGTGTNVDNAALTSNGAGAALHVTANTRNGATTVKVQHSVDNSTWVDLISFASVGSATVAAERASATGTVNRHLRATWTLAGSTGSITFTVAAARR